MTVKNESFLVLEEALATRIKNAWVKSVTPVLNDIAVALDEGDFPKASNLVSKIDFSEAVKKNEKFIRLVGMNAILYGATKFKHAKNTSFSTSQPPDILHSASQTTVRMLTENVNELLRKKAAKLIHEYEQSVKPHAEKAEVRRKALGTFSKEFISSITAGGKAMADMGASLHTSRLASWGFLTEATIQGVDKYEISEVLDSRTCPVCELMNGKAFSVPRAKGKMEQLLRVENPDDLREMAPWPDQSKDSIVELERLSNTELASRGLDTPPFHPMCRGILKKTNQQVPVDSGLTTNNSLMAAAAASGLGLIEFLKKLLGFGVAEGDKGS